jgi:hypothetical protein
MPLLPVWAIMACSRENFTFTLQIIKIIIQQFAKAVHMTVQPWHLYN